MFKAKCQLFPSSSVLFKCLCFFFLFYVIVKRRIFAFLSVELPIMIIFDLFITKPLNIQSVVEMKQSNNHTGEVAESFFVNCSSKKFRIAVFHEFMTFFLLK